MIEHDFRWLRRAVAIQVVLILVAGSGVVASAITPSEPGRAARPEAHPAGTIESAMAPANDPQDRARHADPSPSTSRGADPTPAAATTSTTAEPAPSQGPPPTVGALTETSVAAVANTNTNANAKANGDGHFHVVGRSIIGPDGAVFVPRGVNKSGLEWRSDGYDLAWWNFVRMKGWGANVVRLPLSPHFWLPSMCTYDPAYMARVDQVVAWTEALGMLVILDDHWSTQGRTCGASGWASQQKMADLQNVEFLRSLADRYKDHPWVAFDLYNEPHDISDAVWRDGGTVDGWQAVGMQQLLDTVRATGATNLVFASGNMWANDLRMVVERPLRHAADVVYAAHSYPLWCNGPVGDDVAYWCEGRQIPPFLDTMVAPAIARRAVMVTEFGTRRPIAGEVSAAIEWFEAHGVGWSAWLWGSGPASEYCLLSAAWDLEPSVIGLPVRDALWAANGWHSLFGR